MVDRQEIIHQLASPGTSKMVLLVLDGIGDLPMEGTPKGKTGFTPLMTANTINLDAIARESELGQTIPVLPGITPGSGPGHLSLFGYDPLRYEIGRGILEALGIDVEVGEKDLVARGNFCTLEGDIIVDRRAGRPSTEENIEVCKIINSAIRMIEDVEVRVIPGKEHRFVLKLTGEGLDDHLADADPQRTGVPYLLTRSLNESSEKAARVINTFLKRLQVLLKDQPKLNFGLIRGFSRYPDIPNFNEVNHFRSACIATYPMYKGIAKLVGMDVLEGAGTIAEEFDLLERHYEAYDFFYMHIKKTDSYGEDGNFEAKTKVIEEVDKEIPRLLALDPDVIAVTGDHSTPCVMKAHSWHPVPFMIRSQYCRKGVSTAFDETQAALGTLGTFPAVDAITLIMAHAMRLDKYGA